MNQPSSACGTLLNDSIAIAQNRPTVQLPNHPSNDRFHNHQPFATRTPSREATIPDEQMGGLDLPLDHQMDVDDMPLGDEQRNVPTPDTATLENFPGASLSYPGGKTFMDEFFADQHGALRNDNLFYPFASQQDWQIASWLLRSRLSMAAIDAFLALDLVSETLIIMLQVN